VDILASDGGLKQMLRMTCSLESVAVLIAVSCMGCASTRLPQQALTMSAALGPTCIGIASSSGVRVWDAGRSALIPLPGDLLSSGVLARDGTVLISQGFEIDLTRRPFSRRAVPIPHPPVAVSADGSRVAWRGQDTATGASAIIVYDRNVGLSSIGGSDGDEISLSPDGRRLAIADAGTLGIYQSGIRLASLKGTRPSWWGPSTVAYLVDPMQFELMDLNTMQTRRFPTVGRPLTSLQRSLRSGHVLYATRTPRDNGASPWSSCPERYRVLVQLDEASTPVAYHFGCKGSDPASIQWINSPEVCAAAREQIRLDAER
jgi:hypothetical protein